MITPRFTPMRLRLTGRARHVAFIVAGAGALAIVAPRRADPSGGRAVALTHALKERGIVAVADDGTGAAPQAEGVGIRSMRERAELIGGTCAFRFQPGHGTTVTAALPVSRP